MLLLCSCTAAQLGSYAQQAWQVAALPVPLPPSMFILVLVLVPPPACSSPWQPAPGAGWCTAPQAAQAGGQEGQQGAQATVPRNGQAGWLHGAC